MKVIYIFFILQIHNAHASTYEGIHFRKMSGKWPMLSDLEMTRLTWREHSASPCHKILSLDIHSLPSPCCKYLHSPAVQIRRWLNTHSDFLQLSPQPPCVFLLEIPSVSWNKEPFGVRSRLRVGWSEISWTKLSKSRFVLPFPDFSYVVSQRPTSAPRWRLGWHRAAHLGPFGRRKAGWGLWWH